MSQDFNNNHSAGIIMKNWDIYGVSQPDAITYFKKSDGKEYIITSNEGDAKVRGKQVSVE